ncbi:Salicyloyl-CoA 5-hydroxylase [bacterium HR40]|nr:Salicyloyl-CoA 5-hydroxylase [bacterium HR40]
MRIAVVGGGPGGLYFALLAARDIPGAEIDVFERNAPDDTFGFGVVFSDSTLDSFEATDRPSYEAIRDNFAYWDDIEVHFKGTVHRIGGNGFCGCSRVSLLAILHERCRQLGVRLHFRREIESLDALSDYHLVVAADGVNSRFRETFRDHFRPEVDLRPNRFAWMGSTRPLDAFTFFFRETPWGLFIAHCYQYEKGRSTWVLETDPETFARAGLEGKSEEESARFLEGVFADELGGHRLLTNRSHWRRFPMIRCRTWVRDRLVLIGDAKGTAHFSIGSGTKLAMEDAIALHDALLRHPDIPAALAAFDQERREEVEKTQHAADVSLVWFEHVRRYWHMTPVQFCFGLMSRAKAVTYDNLRLRDASFVDLVDRDAAEKARALGFDVPDPPPPPMFLPFRLREMVLDNRVVVSPMCMYSAEDGVPNDWHLVHLGSRAIGGAGLVYTEMTDVAPEARISPGCTGLWNDAQERAWKRIVDFCHAHSRARICLQLGHAGRKGATRRMWEGIDEPLAEGAWPILSASPLPYYPHSQVPREMTREDMDRVIAQFVEATQRAARAGFDMVELHCAHGYLLASFISPLTNRRTDGYGGSLNNRLRFPLEVFEAMRAVWPEERPMSVRISATDWAPGGLEEDEAVEVARAFVAAGCDLIDVSTGQTVPWQKPKYGRMFQVPFADRIRNEIGCATMAVGNITTADQVNTIVAAGRADLVALARPHLSDPYFTLRAAAFYGWQGVQWPVQYAPGADQLYRTLAREREELTQLRLAARPKSHRPVERR